MVDRVDPGERALHRIRVAHVADAELHLGVEVVRAAGVLAVDLARQAVEGPHAVAAAEELVGEVRADEPRPAGDQYQP